MSPAATFSTMETPICTTARILAPQAGIFVAELPNGKKVLAHLSRQLRESGAVVAVGMRVAVEMTAYDFDIARIVRVLDEECKG